MSRWKDFAGTIGADDMDAMIHIHGCVKRGEEVRMPGTCPSTVPFLCGHFGTERASAFVPRPIHVSAHWKVPRTTSTIPL